MIGGHACQYSECEPRFERDMKTKLIRKIYNDSIVTLTADIKTWITRDVVAKYEERTEQKVVANLNATISEKLKKRLAAYKSELRAKIFQEITKEWEARLTSDYRIEVKVEIKRNI